MKKCIFNLFVEPCFSPEEKYCKWAAVYEVAESDTTEVTKQQQQAY